MTVNTINQVDQLQAHLVHGGNLLGTLTGSAAKLGACLYTGPCTVTEFAGLNSTTATPAYLMLFDSIAPPGAGAVPLDYVFVGYGAAGYPTVGVRDKIAVKVTNGAYLAWSSTFGTFTAVATALNMNAEARGV